MIKKNVEIENFSFEIDKNYTFWWLIYSLLEICDRYFVSVEHEELFLYRSWCKIFAQQWSTLFCLSTKTRIMLP